MLNMTLEINKLLLLMSEDLEVWVSQRLSELSYLGILGAAKWILLLIDHFLRFNLPTSPKETRGKIIA